MTTEEKIARRKLSLLDLAQELRNVSRACKVMGYSRQQFYEIRRNYQTYGAAMSGARGRIKELLSVSNDAHRIGLVRSTARLTESV